MVNMIVFCPIKGLLLSPPWKGVRQDCRQRKRDLAGGRKCLANRQRVKKGEVWNYELEGVVNVMGFMEDKGLIGLNTRHENE